MRRILLLMLLIVLLVGCAEQSSALVTVVGTENTPGNYWINAVYVGTTKVTNFAIKDKALYDELSTNIGATYRLTLESCDAGINLCVIAAQKVE